MEVKVKLSNLRVAPRKARLVVDLVRGKTLEKAREVLSFTVNKSARNVLKLLNSAAASATHDLHLDESNLFISKITIDEGPKLKRWHPMSRGRAYPIIKRTSHIALALAEINPTAQERPNKKENKKEIKSEIKSEKKEVKKEIKKTKPVARKKKTAKK
jgi:large subunit ribosomal protein L22